MILKIFPADHLTGAKQPIAWLLLVN